MVVHDTLSRGERHAPFQSRNRCNLSGKIVPVIKLPLFSQETGPAVQTLLELAGAPHAGLRVGSVKLQPNERVPAEGLSQHPVDEVSLIIKGSLTGESGGETFAVGACDVTLIPAGEPHWAVAGPDGAEILWMWFGNTTHEE